MAPITKNTMVVALFLTIIVALTTAQDVSLLLRDRNIVNRGIGCVLNRNPCDVIGKQIKALLPEALRGCGRCSPQQAANAHKLMGYMKQNHPNEWFQIVQLYGRARNVRAAV